MQGHASLGRRLALVRESLAGWSSCLTVSGTVRKG